MKELRAGPRDEDAGWLLLPSRKVDIKPHGKGNSKLSWRKAGQPRHLVNVVDSDQEVVNKELSLSLMCVLLSAHLLLSRGCLFSSCRHFLS